MAGHSDRLRRCTWAAVDGDGGLWARGTLDSEQQAVCRAGLHVVVMVLGRTQGALGKARGLHTGWVLRPKGNHADLWL